MAEYDFRILYDSHSPLFFHRFPYHQYRDDYTSYEFIENEVSHEEVFRKVSPATENLMLKTASRSKNLFDLRQKINTKGTDGILPNYFEYLGILTGYFYEADSKLIDANYVCKQDKKKASF